MKHQETKGIYKRGDIYWYAPPMVRGRRPAFISLKTRNLSEAIEERDAILANPELEAGSNLLSEIEAHLRRKTEGKVPEYNRSTAECKRYKLKTWASAYPKKTELPDITQEHLQAFYDEIRQRCSIPTAHKYLMDVRALFNDALERRQVRRNPAIGVREREMPNTARIRYCERELRDKLIDEAPSDDLRFVLMCGFHAGFRKNEIIEAVPFWFNMKLRHIDLRSTDHLRFTTHKQARTVPMRQIFFDFLSGYGLRDPYMLRPDVERGKNIYRYEFAKPFRAYMIEQGVPWVTPHVMRHTFASLLAIGGTSIFKIARWLGDSVTVTENVYAHLAPSDPDIEESGSGSASSRSRA